jgi:hypothetical protein
MAAPYMSMLHPYLTQERTYDARMERVEVWALRRHGFYFAGQADDRYSYKSRVKARHAFLNLNQTFVTIQPGVKGVKETRRLLYRHHSIEKHVTVHGFNATFADQVTNTRYGLHIAGDNPTSSRLYEFIDAGCVIVLLSDKMHRGWLPGQKIPWVR